MRPETFTLSHPDAGTLLRIFHPRTKILDNPCDFVTQDDWQLYKGKIAVPNHEVTMAHAACMNSN
jgi:hypothetical protein